MREINLFCFGFGQVAKEFVNKILGQKIKINLITTSRQKSAELNFLNLKYKNFYFDENNFDNDLLNEVEGFDYILVSTPPANQKDLFLELLNSNKKIINKAKWITYLSSTSVYGDHGGEWVDENSELVPNTEKGKIRFEIEKKWKKLLKDHPIQIFRLAGIYSKNENLVTRIKKNNIKIVIKNNHKFSRVHLEDISGFLFSSLKNFKSGEIYNIADDQPLSNEEIVNEVIEKYSLKPPPFVDYKDLKNSTVKDFYLSSKKIKNDKAKIFFGYELIYPTLREGLNLL